MICSRLRTARFVLAAAGLGLCGLLTLPLGVTGAETAGPSEAASAMQDVATTLANEVVAAQHKDHYVYLSRERSERTGGHLWTEKVVETDAGKVRMLLAEDGQPLSPGREAQERGRLAQIVADPEDFEKKSQATKDDEAHAVQMLALLPKAFLFGDAREQGSGRAIDFKPNPGYQPRSMEERVLHGMSGTLVIDPKAMRLRHIEARLSQDVSIGFGLLATIRAGSNFATTRDPLGQLDWKTTTLDTDINGRAIFFKTIARSEHAEHSDFVRVPLDLTVAQAVALAEQ
ncbi:MAG: hypothetical protein ABR910_17020 [Acidobacteriaceae bacterium]|jgi:hypothetical protein